MARMAPQEVADELGMSLSWVYENKHRIGYLQFGTAVRFERTDVEEYAGRCKRGPSNGERTKWESLCDTEKRGTAGLSRKRTTVSDINERLTDLGKGKSKRASTSRPARLN